MQRIAIVQIRSLNLAPPESLLPEFLRVARLSVPARAIGWIDRAGCVRTLKCATPVLFIAHFVSGKSVFPIAAPLSAELPVVDTDFNWHDTGEALKEILRKDGALNSAVWMETLVHEKGAPSVLHDYGSESANRVADRMRSALATLAVDETSAAGLVSVALGLGRVVPAELLKVVQKDGGAVVRELDRLDPGRLALLDCIFGSGEGA